MDHEQSSENVDEQIIDNIGNLVAEERALRNRSTDEQGLAPDEMARLRELEIQLDQCWDLLRRRRAKTEFGEDPGTVKERPAEEVENYRS
ncbi:DUF2630 family protein [Streptomyces xantholiticus]|uniref:DUF2630 family protein n=1 Tax=Streptomyces xantholiticus TaxID=68285 RepID=A0ABV1UUY4_9ACTN|nr:hypothetical protein CGZ69_18425 [Streptomyces peucetius subsp. caesius ATCC 27952]